VSDEVSRFPIGGFQRWQNALGKRAVPCIVNNRWLQLPERSDRFEDGDYPDGDYMFVEWIEIPEACNWKVSVENYSECYHCSITHKTFSTGVIKPQTYDIQPQGHCLRHTTESQNLDRMSYPVDLTSDPRAGNYSSWFLWPMFSFQVYPGNLLNTYHWRIKSVNEVIVWRGWYTVDGAESDVIRKLAIQDRVTTVAEDIRIVEAVQRGLNNRGYRPGPLVIRRAGSTPSTPSGSSSSGCAKPPTLSAGRDQFPRE
jgi:phenylpropionate dioxygenase-like ring-hydroxylating dioxygenase large terminal subunit